MNYLHQELLDKVQSDRMLWEWFQDGSLDGIWYWDLENPREEWMSNRFWSVLGYDPAGKPHKAEAWQDLIHPDDLTKALQAYEAHVDEGRDYSLVVRYKAGPHRRVPGGWVYVRCRGLVLRNEEGQPVRMLGAHNDVTDLCLIKLELEQRLGEIDLRLEALEDRKCRHDGTPCPMSPVR